jgi:ubiquinone/menaquinone biosynthesis C-methylase UbiE
MSALKEIFDSHNGHLLHKWHHYFDVYTRYFEPYRNKPLNILEIGISHGGSLQMWRKYFGEQANIFAVDINPECKKFEKEKTKIFIGSQEDEVFLKQLYSQLPELDILIDDGGHTMKQQVVTFENLFPIVKDGGIYLVEDTHTSYWREYHGGYKNKNSFIEFSKNIVDQMYAWHIDNEKIVPVNYNTKNINSISFYDSIVVFEKRHRQEPSHSMKGEATINPYADPTLKKDSVIMRIKKKLYPKKVNSFFRQLKSDIGFQVKTMLNMLVYFLIKEERPG